MREGLKAPPVKEVNGSKTGNTRTSGIKDARRPNYELADNYLNRVHFHMPVSLFLRSGYLSKFLQTFKINL